MKLLQVRQGQNHMATTFDFCVSCAEDRANLADRILTEAHLLVTQLENELSEFLPDSPVYKLNRAAPLALISFPQSALDLLKHSEKIRAVTSGSFNCAAKSSPHESAGPRIGWDLKSKKAWRIDAGAHLGFGAIGKGYALDRVRLLIESHGFKDYLLSAGGSSLILSGFEAPGTPWRWGWSWKKDTNTSDAIGIPFSHTTGYTLAIGVSGLHEKGEHLIDPRSGDKAIAASSALVGHPSAAEADALSTALFVSGWNESIKYMQKMDVSPAIAEIDAQGVPKWNGIFQRLWGPCEKTLFMLLAAFAFSRSASAEDTVDLGSLGLNRFTPYVFDRSGWWALLPILSIAVVLVHLKKVRKTSMKQKIKSNLSVLISSALLWASLEKGQAQEIEPMGKALASLLGTTKVSKKVLPVDGKDATIYYAKDASGKPQKVAFIEQGLYPPDCTHTWAIGINPKTGKVTEVRPIEMKCPHAFPAKEARFLDQFKGKGPADTKKLTSDISTIAKATGTCNLTTDAVKKSITAFSKIKGKL